MTEKKEMTEEEKEFRYKNMYKVEEYEDFSYFTATREEKLNLLLFNIYYQLTRIADHVTEEQSPIK